MSGLLRAGVIGWPVKQSKSPRLHGHWLKKYDIPGSYEHVEVAPEDFNKRVHALVADGWRGANVTIPHKEAALALAAAASDIACAIGAANTLIFRGDGTIHADNTDGFGFIENLRQGARTSWIAQEPAVVLGAGGAARAIIHSLLDAGASEIRLTNRTSARAEHLAQRFGSKVKTVPWEKAACALSGAGLIVNTTSLGMKGGSPLDLDLAQAPMTAIVTDIVYTPLMTGFLQAAADRGLTTVDGLGMLLHQARPGFQAWFGPTPEVDDELRSLMLAP
jgi:shikimate dehydrogenase